MRAFAALAIFCVTAVLAFSGEIRTAQLPHEARQALEQIRAGGPFSHPNDGRTFNNREARLPRRERGYYREYTVPTPELRERGARRIVAGRGGEFYYTDDHYRTFKRITE
jgi:ribonuclease T1